MSDSTSAVLWTGENPMVSLSQFQAKQRKLISNISHELRTPLTLVYGYIQSIYRRSENLTDLQKDALEIAMLEMKRTIYVLQESLDLARLENSAIPMPLQPVLLHDLVAEVTSTFQAAQREIVVEGNDLNISVLADTDNLRQVLLRLVDNAIKYSNTAVTIKIEKLENYIAINLCDRGCGIPAQDLPYIFSPFYRVDRSRNRHTGGTGLGLAIAKALVEGMGGTLSVHSQINEGSVFKVMLKSSV